MARVFLRLELYDLNFFVILLHKDFGIGLGFTTGEKEASGRNLVEDMTDCVAVTPSFQKKTNGIAFFKHCLCEGLGYRDSLDRSLFLERNYCDIHNTKVTFIANCVQQFVVPLCNLHFALCGFSFQREEECDLILFNDVFFLCFRLCFIVEDEEAF